MLTHDWGKEKGKVEHIEPIEMLYRYGSIKYCNHSLSADYPDSRPEY